jgi:hypothetical protein
MLGRNSGAGLDDLLEWAGVHIDPQAIFDQLQFEGNADMVVFMDVWSPKIAAPAITEAAVNCR